MTELGGIQRQSGTCDDIVADPSPPVKPLFETLPAPASGLERQVAFEVLDVDTAGEQARRQRERARDEVRSLAPGRRQGEPDEIERADARKDAGDRREGTKGREGDCDEARFDHARMVPVPPFVPRCRNVGWVIERARPSRRSRRRGRVETDPSRRDEVDRREVRRAEAAREQQD